MPTRVLKWVTGAALTGALMITAGAFKLSFESLSALARMAGITSGDSWIWPVIIDGLIVVATLAILALAGHGRRALAYPWTLLFSGAAASVVANAEHAQLTHLDGVSAPVAMVIAAVPPIVMLASTHLGVVLIQRAARARAFHAATAAVPALTAPVAPMVVAPAPQVAFVPAPERVPPASVESAPVRVRVAAKPATTSAKVTPELVARVLALRGTAGEDGKPLSESKIAKLEKVPKSRVHQILTSAQAAAPDGAVAPHHSALSLVGAVA